MPRNEKIEVILERVRNKRKAKDVRDIHSAQALVLFHDSNIGTWSPLDDGVSVLTLYSSDNPVQFRVVGLKESDKSEVINACVTKKTEIKALSANFLSMSAGGKVYGLGFNAAADADAFMKKVNNCVAKLKNPSGGGGGVDMKAKIPAKAKVRQQASAPSPAAAPTPRAAEDVDVAKEDHRATNNDWGIAPLLMLFGGAALFAAGMFFGSNNEESNSSEERSDLTVPQYWTAVSSLEAVSDPAREDATPELKDTIQRLMNKTAKKDNGWIVGGRDNQRRHRSYDVVRVTRIENPRVMREYDSQRKYLASLEPPQTEVASHDEGLWRDLNLEKGGNEVLLFHGCKPEIVGVIVEQGFDERVCDLNGLYGAAVYFAENASKSGEYAVEDQRSGNAFMFLSRVALGRPHERAPGQHLPGQRRPPCLEGGHTDCTHVRADSVIGTSMRFGYREFMVYDRRQAYPELLIEFKRV